MLSLIAGGVQEFIGICVMMHALFYWDGLTVTLETSHPLLGTASKWTAQKDSAEKISDRVLTFLFKWMLSLY